jgi:hypothetical protein
MKNVFPPDKDFGIINENANFVRNEPFHKHYAMISNNTPSTLVDRLLNDPSFRDEFVSMPELVEIVRLWLKANKRQRNDSDIKETCQTAYEIARWNAGLKDTDTRKKDLSDAKFWTNLPKLIDVYADIWLKQEEGKSYVRDLIQGVIPDKVKKKIETFCTDRCNWLGLAKNESIVEDMCQEVYLLFFDKKPFKSINNPGTLWAYLRTTVNHLFSDSQPKLCFTESFLRNRKKTSDGEKDIYSFAHLSIYTWSPTALEKFLINDNLYEERICHPLRSLIEQHYSPDDTDRKARDAAGSNAIIKEEVFKLFESIRKEYEQQDKPFPAVDKDDIGLSYDATPRESYLLTKDKTPALRRILSEGVDLPDPNPPAPRPCPRPDDPVPIVYMMLTETEAMDMVDEIFGKLPKENEDLRVLKLELFFDTNYCEKNKKSPELSKYYAQRLEGIGAFKSQEGTSLKNYMSNLYKAKKDIRERFTKGARRLLQNNRYSAEDIIAVIHFFGSHNYYEVYQKLNRK